MEKTISITLNHQSFIIEEKAYKRLAEYLENIKAHCGTGIDSVEVIFDIENSMAEKLKSNLNPYKEVIDLTDVESLIKIMGTADDFDREVGKTDTPEEEFVDQKINRKLYRDSDKAIIGGVATGLGNYFNLDPVLIRIIFIALIFAGGSGFLIYVLLWIAMPEAKTAHQKLEMKGQAPTLAAFKELSKTGKKIQTNLKNSSLLEKIFKFPATIIKTLILAISNIWKKVWPIIKFIFGLGISVFSFIGLGVIGVSSLLMLLYNNSSYEFYFIPITELTALMPYTYLVISGFLSLAIPTTVAFICGLSILFKKNILNFPISLIILVVWMASGIFFCAGALRYFPEVQNKFNQLPLIQNEEKVLDLKDVNEIEISGSRLNVFVSNNTSTPTTLAGRQIDLKYLKIEPEGNKLIIKELKNNTENICFNCDLYSVDLKIASSSKIKITTNNGAYLINEELSE